MALKGYLTTKIIIRNITTGLQQSKFSDSPSLYEYLMLTKHLPMWPHVLFMPKDSSSSS
ncbi:hypothetical protein Hanom_Chr01g00078331 [Helianthus anomalus]